MREEPKAPKQPKKKINSAQGFSPKQLMVLKFPYTDYDALIADGAIRSGKTSVMSLSYVLWAMNNFNNCNFIIAGKTVQSCERNVINPLIQVKYLTDHFDCKYTRTNHILRIQRGNKVNYFYVFGGKDESSFMLVQGLTAAGAFFDEVALMPQSFVLQAMARCSVEGSKLWFNCNPESPSHWFYLEWIINPKSKNALHLHFTMEDNPSLSEKKKAYYRSSYTGVFYQRYIKGEWVRAEGCIYSSFTEDNEKYIVDSIDFEKTKFMKFNIGVDFGGNGSKHSFILTGITLRYQNVYVLESELIDPNTTPAELEKQYCKFVKKCFENYPQIMFTTTYADSAEQVLKRGLAAASLKNNLKNKVENSRKDEIIERIRLVTTLMSQGRFFIKRSCKSLINALNNAVWDSKQKTDDVRLDDGTSDIDSLDAFEYTIERDKDNLINAILQK